MKCLEEKKGRGRQARWVEKFKSDNIDFCRYEEVLRMKHLAASCGESNGRLLYRRFFAASRGEMGPYKKMQKIKTGAKRDQQ